MMDGLICESRATLEALVRDFDCNVVENRQRIRDLLDKNREAFFRNAVDLLRSFDDSSGFRRLVEVLVSSGLLLRALCEPHLTKAEAMALGRAAVTVDPMADVVLAKELVDTALPDGGSVQMDAAPRIMEILAAISDGSRILPSMMRLMRHSNPYIRSKAVLMIGLGGQSAKWLRGRLADADPRVRANAIEAMWGVDSAEAQMLLRYALTDSDHRAVGNALLGLYYLGDCSVIPKIVKMAAHEAGLFRAAAAWVMGETGDPRFIKVLVRMLADLNTIVRKRAFAALGRIKAAAAIAGQGAQWRMGGVIQTDLIQTNLTQTAAIQTNQAHEAQKNLRKIHLAVTAEAGVQQPTILPTQFMLTEGAQDVLSYKVTEKAAPKAAPVVFILPWASQPAIAPWNLAALHCLAWKSPSDLWCNLPFCASPDPQITGPSPEEPQFTSGPEALGAAFGRAPARVDCPDLWGALGRALRPDQARSRGACHLIVVVTEEIGSAAGNSLISNLIGAAASLQVISSVANPRVEDFCRHAKGRFRTFENQAEIPELVQEAYLSLLARYEIAYRPVSPAATVVRARVQTPSGWGEIKIPLLAE